MLKRIYTNFNWSIFCNVWITKKITDFVFGIGLPWELHWRPLSIPWRVSTNSIFLFEENLGLELELGSKNYLNKKNMDELKFFGYLKNLLTVLQEQGTLDFGTSTPPRHLLIFWQLQCRHWEILV